MPLHDTVSHTPELRRAQGAMVGAAVGGSPGEASGLTAGTTLGLALAESLLEHGRYVPDAVSARWQACGMTGGEHAAVARVFPVGVAFFGVDDATVLDVCLRQAALTDSGPVTAWAGWIAAELIRFAIAGDDLWPELERLVDDVPHHVRRPFVDGLAPTWAPSARDADTVPGCLARAVWAVRSTTTFAEAVGSALAFGDEGGTVGCVAGAIAGARYGIGAIPAPWADALQGTIDAEQYDTARLLGMTERLFGLATG